jgi:hypothetical protein
MATSKLSLKFRIFKNNELVGVRELSQNVIKIGKVATSHLHLEDESVSRMHAIVEVLDTTAHVIDLGSTRGTFVNGTKINKAKLSDGDQIQIGDLRLELVMTELAATQTAAPEVKAAVPPPVPVAAKPAPTPTMPKYSPVAPATFAAATADDEPGARAIEVATMLGDSVVDVKHCMDPKGGKVTPMTWGFIAGGLACLLASATAFYISVDTAAANKASLQYHTQVLHKPAYSHRPVTNSVAVDYAAFGGLAFGLLGMTAGLLRARGEKKSPYYRIGTAPGVNTAVEQAPTSDFPMVAPSGDDFVFNYGAGMDGEMIVDGKSTPLAELVGAGRARPSTMIASAIEVPIPAKAKIRARAGQTTFLVSAVNKPKAQAVPLFSMERRTAAYIAGSLAIHMGIIAFLQTIPPDDSGVNVDLNSIEGVAIRAQDTAKDDVPLKPEEDKDDGASGTPSAGGKMAFEEGAAGKPDAKQEQGHMRVKDRGETKQLSREAAIEEATSAGIMGSVHALETGIKAINGTAEFSSGFDGSDVYGPLFGAEGEGRGNFGMGVTGWGPGGGCTMEPCGLVGTGRYGTIGNGDKAGDGWGIGGTGKGRGWKRTAGVPPVDISNPIPVGGLDKSIIKRYVKRNLSKIQYCYESQLLASPNLAGTVNVAFMIAPDGTVQTSKATGLDDSVASCVAGVVKNISFPRPSDGGPVQVTYPFIFRAAGH